MSKTSRNLRAFSWGKFSWTEIICVKKLTFCNSDRQPDCQQVGDPVDLRLGNDVGGSALDQSDMAGTVGDAGQEGDGSCP